MKALVVSVLITNLLLQPVYNPQQIQQETNGLGLEHLQKINIQLETTHKKVMNGQQELQEMLLEHERLLEQRRLLEEEWIQKEAERKLIQSEYKTILKDLGYYKNHHKNEEINERDAVLRFQSDHNLTVDGVFGPVTTEALRKRLSDDNYQHPDKINQPPTDGKWIVVNKTKRILTLYQGREVLKKYPVAQGKSKNLTPEGKFTIVVKTINPAWGGAGIAAPVAGGAPNNPLGPRWLGLSHGGGGRYGIHGNANPVSIGTDASLGCVRMINSDVEALYDIIPLRTIVWIGSDAQLQQWGVNQVEYAGNSSKDY